MVESIDDSSDGNSYQYDVAFSLLAQDEGLAYEINNLLSDRYKTFLYSQRQQEIAGTDGELKFKKVFTEEARFIVVLYRKGWGETPWTRMEEEAIRGRAYDEGYEFVKFIPLDEVQEVPKYLPKTQLWINALRFGAKGAASVIEARLQEMGVTAVKETSLDHAARLKRQIDFDKRSKNYLESVEGVKDANQSFAEIGDAVELKVNQINDVNGLGLISKRERQNIVVIGLKSGLRINWSYSYANSLSNSGLEVQIWSGHPPMSGLRYYDQPKQRKAIKFMFELMSTGCGAWSGKDGLVHDADAIAELALNYYFENGN